MNLEEQLEEERRIINTATEGPWEIQQGTPTMSGNTWTLRVQGKPGIRIGAHEYQHGAGNSDFIVHARTALPLRNAQLQAVLRLVREERAQGYNAVSLDRLTRAIKEATP